MGGIGKALFGGSDSKQESHNQAYPYLQDAYGGQVATGTQANTGLANALGLNGQASQAGFNGYKDSAGFQSTLDAGSQAITGNNASRGLLQSGATAKALSNFGQQTNQNYYNNYLQSLLGLSQQGISAGGLIGGSGTTSSGSSSQKNGMGKFLGSLAAGIPGA